VNVGDVTNRRRNAVERAQRHAPFLREAMIARHDIVERFLMDGPQLAAEQALSTGAEDVEAELRRRRRGLSLAVALGDLSGELPLEQVTAFLSDFADSAIDRAIAAAIAEQFPGEDSRGFAAIALGKLGSGELNFSSDVDLILLFDPATLPRRQRDEQRTKSDTPHQPSANTRTVKRKDAKRKETRHRRAFQEKRRGAVAPVGKDFALILSTKKGTFQH